MLLSRETVLHAEMSHTHNRDRARMFGLGVVVLGTGKQRFGARLLPYRAHHSPGARAEISGHLVISLRCARRSDDPEGYIWIRANKARRLRAPMLATPTAAQLIGTCDGR